jgi:hypothetical protein
VLRSRRRVQLAKTSRSSTSAAESIFARFPGIVGSTSLVKYIAASLLEQ